MHMITQAVTIREHSGWEKVLKDAIRCPKALLRALNLPEDAIAPPSSKQFNLLVPMPFVNRMAKQDLKDPLLLQVLTRAQEDNEVEGFEDHPLEEDKFSPIPGLLHKFKTRVLLTIAGSCPVHCRYCFRRHFPYSANTGRKHWGAWLEYCQVRPDIKEVIFSGGDPLSLPDRLLGELLVNFDGLDHIEVLRFHTRYIVMIPERVTDTLIEYLRNCRSQVVMVMHINHPNEIDDAVVYACQRLRAAGVHLLNQGVLLKGINDTSDTLIGLSWRLLSAGIMPYYMHLLDKVAGAAHFEVSKEAALGFETELRESLPGYAVPEFVKEVPGAPSKVPISTLF